MELNVLDSINYWKSVYEDEYQLEMDTQDSLMSLTLDDLMDGLDFPSPLF